MPFLLLQVSALLINETPVLALARFQGAGSVAEYAIFMRIFGVCMFLINAIDAPYAGAYREAWVRGDHAWLARQIWKVQAVKMAVTTSLALALLMGGPWAAGQLSHGEIVLSRATCAWGAALMLASAWGGGILGFFVMFDRLPRMVMAVAINAVVTVPLIALGTITLGVSGAVAGTTAFSLLIGTWWMPWLLRRELRGLHDQRRARGDDVTA
jgi:O-antigen/teichoic acid export membrane protein